MGFLKFASTTIENLSGALTPPELSRLEGARSPAFKAIMMEPQKFLYLRTRAVSAGELHGPNGNGDFFPHAELAERYGTFINCPVNVDHDNEDPRRAIGIVLDSHYHDKPQGWVEVLEALDREKTARHRPLHIRSSNLLKAIESSEVTDTSMGCFVEESECSVCANRAREEIEYCDHIAVHKGKIIQHGGREVPAYEVNHGITFFEDSVITTTAENVFGGGGADPDAKIMQVIANHQPAGWERFLVNHHPMTIRIRTEGVDRIRFRY